MRPPRATLLKADEWTFSEGLINSNRMERDKHDRAGILPCGEVRNGSRLATETTFGQSEREGRSISTFFPNGADEVKEDNVRECTHGCSEFRHHHLKMSSSFSALGSHQPIDTS